MVNTLLEQHIGGPLKNEISTVKEVPQGYVVADIFPKSSLMEPTSFGSNETPGSKYDEILATYPNVVFVDRNEFSVDMALPVDDTKEAEPSDNLKTSPVAVGRIAVTALRQSPYNVPVHHGGDNAQN